MLMRQPLIHLKVSRIIKSCITIEQIYTCSLWIENIKGIDDWTKGKLSREADQRWGEIEDKNFSKGDTNVISEWPREADGILLQAM